MTAAAAITAVGLAVIALFVLDVIVTILSTARAGPVTTLWSRALWRGLLRLHRRRRVHLLLSMTGPAIVLLTILVWYAGLVVGTWIVLRAHPGSVVSSTTREPADPEQAFYFVPTTLSGLGYGDFVPNGPPWTAFATTMTLLTTVVLTLSLSYVISVVSAAISTRSMASGISAMGDDAGTLVRHAALGDPSSSMKEYLGGIASSVSQVAERQLAYPVLRYFHSPRPQSAAAPAVLMLSDAVFVMRHAPPSLAPGVGLRGVLESAIAEYATVKRTPQHFASEGTGASPLREQASAVGVDVAAGSAFDQALPEYLQRRAVLIAACRDDGWADLVTEHR